MGKMLRKKLRRTAGSLKTHGSTADYLGMLKEIDRHIEALALVRKDNDWDMCAAKREREKIVNAWSNTRIEAR